MRGGPHPHQSLRAPFLGRTVYAKPGALLLPSPGRRKERRKVAKKVENFLWGKLGTTRNGETWFPGKTGRWEAKYLPRGTRTLHPPRMPLSARGCVALAARASPSPVSLFLFHSLRRPESLPASELSPRAPPSSTVYPHGNRLLYVRLTSPGSARGAGGVHLARKQLGSIRWKSRL